MAATSGATITSSMTGASGPEHYMSGSNILKGENYNSSTNTLYIEAYKTVTGPDTNVLSIGLAPGSIQNWRSFTSAGYHYVHLDPAGAYARGCNGWGQVID